MSGESTSVEELLEPLDVDAEASPPRVLKLVLEYDGTDFCGWQLQPGQRSVQGTLTEAVRNLLGDREVAVVAAGRTDSGVHAAGQVAHLQTVSGLPVARVRSALNAILPTDLRVRRVSDEAADFHARHGATSREYRYQIWRDGAAPPFLRRYCHQARGRLDVDAMVVAAGLFVGTRDLSAFRAASCEAPNPVRTITHSELTEHGPLLVYSIEAPAFLQHMVRIVVGTLLAVGHGRLDADGLAEILQAGDRRRAAATAAAAGLFLFRVNYGDDRSLAGPPGPVLNFSGNYT